MFYWQCEGWKQYKIINQKSKPFAEIKKISKPMLLSLPTLTVFIHLSEIYSYPWNICYFRKSSGHSLKSSGSSEKPSGELPEKLDFIANSQLFIHYSSCLVITVSLHICIFKPFLQYKISQRRNGEKPCLKIFPIFTNWTAIVIQF